MKEILSATVYTLGVLIVLWIATLPFFDDSYPRQWGAFCCTIYVITVFGIGWIAHCLFELKQLKHEN